MMVSSSLRQLIKITGQLESLRSSSQSSADQRQGLLRTVGDGHLIALIFQQIELQYLADFLIVFHKQQIGHGDPLPFF